VIVVVAAAGAFYKGRGRSRGRRRHLRDIIIDRNDNVFSIIIVVVRKQMESAPFLILLLLFTAVMLLLLPVRALSQIVYSIFCARFQALKIPAAAPHRMMDVCLYYTHHVHVSRGRL
jgi:hypothetical protein